MRYSIPVFVAMLFVVPAGLSDSGAPEGCQTQLDFGVHRDAAYATDPMFAKLFPDKGLMVTQDWSRLPTIPEFWAVDATGACDLSDLDAALAAAGRQLDTRAAYEAAAWLAALATDPEKLGHQTLASIDSFERTDDGALVTLTAKSPDTGAIVAWTVSLSNTGATDATWEVIAHEKGLRTEIEGWYLGIGETGPSVQAVANLPDEKFYPTHDGKMIRIVYDEDHYPNVAEADEDVDRNGNGAVYAYNTMHGIWGFPSADNDGVMEISMDGCACIFGGNNVDIHMPRNLQQWIFDLIGAWYPDEDGVVTDVVGHEYFHHFQYSIMQWNQGSWVVEGTARFAETAFTPEFCHTPDSLQFRDDINGFGYVMANPDIAPQSHSYSYGLVWGHIYDLNGGIDVIRRVLEESASNPSFPGFIDRALAASPGAHDTFEEAIVDMGPRMVAHDFVWDRWDGSASYDWAAYLDPVEAEEINQLSSADTPGGAETFRVRPYAMHFFAVDHDATALEGGAVMLESPDHVRGFWIANDESGTQTMTEIEGLHADVLSTNPHVFVTGGNGPNEQSRLIGVRV